MIGSVQKRILGELAHQRIAPERAGLTVERLSVLVDRPLMATYVSVIGLRKKGLVTKADILVRITDEGRKVAP